MNNSLNTKSVLNCNNKDYTYFSLKKANSQFKNDISSLPYSLKVVLENLLRFEDEKTVTKDDIYSIDSWLDNLSSDSEIAFRPSRVLMQDFTGVPAIVDLAAMRDAVKNLNGDAQKINPQVPVDLVIDHSVMVDNFGSEKSFGANVTLEMERNNERYKFLKWGQNAFENFRVVPPGTGICHQVNLENLANVVWTKTTNGETSAYPDSLVGTDSHTTMINGLAVLGWGVGGIEAEAAMLGQPISMKIPEVIGVKLTGSLKEGTTATDMVLTITNILREYGVVGKFVEFFGAALDNISLADRATIANMAPEYGATCGFFPIDEKTIEYLELSNRPKEVIELTEKYAKEQGLWRDKKSSPRFSDIIELDISTIEPTIAGPKNPQEKILLSQSAKSFQDLVKSESVTESDLNKKFTVKNKDFDFQHGNIIIAAITSCTNTSNPSVMIAAGLVAKKANQLGMTVPGWVKTSLAPGSKVVSEYLEKSGLQDDLDAIGFNLVGYGCTTCIGNSGPIDEDIENTIKDNNLISTSVLSGNRNFEGRVNPYTKGNYLMSPPLVVAFALAGNAKIDITKESLGKDKNGNDVFLKDIWPSNKEIADAVAENVIPEQFEEEYKNVFDGTKEWQDIDVANSELYPWDNNSTYIQNPPYFEGMTQKLAGFSNIEGAKCLALLGDFTTTDHISPAGVIAKDGAAANYLSSNGVDRKDYNSFGSRRGNHEVMMRGTFANVRLQNKMTPDIVGGYTIDPDSGETTYIYDAAMKHKANKTPLIIIGGKSYGMGSSRDWAAKGTVLLGIKAVIAESFERIHRSNLVGMGVLPLTFKKGENAESLEITGNEIFDLVGIEDGIKPNMTVECYMSRENGDTEKIELLCRIDTSDEVEYFEHGGILQKVIRDLTS